MSKVKRLLQAYSRYIAVPWRRDAAAAQRVIFCIYDEQDELRLRAVLLEFEMATREAGHDWVLFDLTNTFPKWLSGQRYAKSYLQQPHLLATLYPRFLTFVDEEFERFLNREEVGDDTVIALSGVGSLFGFVKVRDVVDKLARRVPGRLVVFFPGSYENNNYRLLDGYDGWNYLAVPITADKEF